MDINITKISEKSGIRMGWMSLCINVGLLVLNFFMAYYSGSLALFTETAHNILDLLVSVLVLTGLRLSQRNQRDFPYGLYKVENMLQAIIAFSIFFTGYEIVRRALIATNHIVKVQPLMLLGVMVALILPYIFSRYEIQVGRQINSPSLIADALKAYEINVYISRSSDTQQILRDISKQNF